jgi:hypothetical protein
MTPTERDYGMSSFDIPPVIPDWLKPRHRHNEECRADAFAVSVLNPFEQAGGPPCLLGHDEWWITSGAGLTFSVKEAAKIFFRKSGSWLRMRLQPVRDAEPGERHPMGWFTEEDFSVPLQVNLVQGKADTYQFRRFTLLDIERMLWSLYRHETAETVWWYTSMTQTGKRGDHRLERYNQMMAGITTRLETGLELVKWMGRLYDLIEMPPRQVLPAQEEELIPDLCMVCFHPRGAHSEHGCSTGGDQPAFCGCRTANFMSPWLTDATG